MRIGERFMLMACVIWLSSSVGPWQLGVAVVLATWFLNFAERYVISYLAKRTMAREVMPATPNPETP